MKSIDLNVYTDKPAALIFVLFTKTSGSVGVGKGRSCVPRNSKAQTGRGRAILEEHRYYTLAMCGETIKKEGCVSALELTVELRPPIL